ncbi:MAG: hypothetical protein AVDCRST_MAG26-1431, partial [uncultured Chloroflexia bacterium]
CSKKLYDDLRGRFHEERRAADSHSKAEITRTLRTAIAASTHWTRRKTGSRTGSFPDPVCYT